ncbi:hypothetical protein [Amorphus coralli]|uniref:hypothetical protein n=1 Tax=Amorphus coralli TaxID=340680 RepID=UPI00035D4EC0|nr:hypothetical protein [Amorphus coralli]
MGIRVSASATHLAVAACVLGGLVMATPASAQSNAALSRKLVDVCIYDQYRKQGDSKGIAKRCQCAARKAGPSLTAGQISALTIGPPLTGAVRDAMYKAIAACTR